MNIWPRQGHINRDVVGSSSVSDLSFNKHILFSKYQQSTARNTCMILSFITCNKSAFCANFSQIFRTIPDTPMALKHLLPLSVFRHKTYKRLLKAPLFWHAHGNHRGGKTLNLLQGPSGCFGVSDLAMLSIGRWKLTVKRIGNFPRCFIEIVKRYSLSLGSICMPVEDSFATIFVIIAITIARTNWFSTPLTITPFKSSKVHRSS